MTTVDKSTKVYSTFEPRYIPDCCLWLDAADRSTNSMTLSGSDVTVWKDKSASGNNATGTPGAYPIINSYNNKQTILFGLSSPLSLTANLLPNGTSEFSVFCVTTPINYLGNDYMILNWGTSSNPNAFRFWVSGSTGGLRQDYFTGSTVNSDNTNVVSSTNIFSNTSTTTATRSYRNGNAFSTNTSAVSYNIGTTFATIGATGTTTLPLFGHVHEIIIYSRSLPDTQRQQVEGYLAWKWGLESSLAVGHPYIASIKHGPVLSIFNPFTQISGCVAWIDASDRSSFTLSGSNVNTITNKATGGTSALTINGTPTWSSTALDGTRPGFNTTNGAFIGTLTSALTNFTNSVFIVTNITGTPLAGDCAVGFMTTATGSVVFYRALDYTASRFRVIAFFSSTYSNIGTIGPIVGTKFLYSSNYSGSTPLNNYLNAGTQSNSAVAVSPSTNPQYFIIGADGFTFSGGNPSSRWKGAISEVLIFNRVLADRERFMIDSYLAHKWGTQGDMPVAHAFKKYPPLTIN